MQFRASTSKLLLLVLPIISTNAASAFNDPVEGRWVTRDPLNYNTNTISDDTMALTSESGRGPGIQMRHHLSSAHHLQHDGYAIYRSNVVFDPSGLECTTPDKHCTCEERHHCETACFQFWQGNYPWLNNQDKVGVVICCCGHKIPCADPNYGSGSPIHIHEAIQACILVHETSHLPNSNCPSCSGPSLGGMPRGPAQIQDECRAYALGMRCLKEKYEECKRNHMTGCERLLREINGSRRIAELEYWCSFW